MENDIRRLEKKMDEMFRKLAEKQNAQFTEIVNEIRRVGNVIETNSDEYIEENATYKEAKKVALEFGKISTSILQRKLRIGYARSARFIDKLEEEGIIEHKKGASPRRVLKKE